jgi:hypothetical protein
MNSGYLVGVSGTSIFPLAVLGMGPRSFSQDVTNNVLYSYYGDECLSLFLHQVLVKVRLRPSES